MKYIQIGLLVSVICWYSPVFAQSTPPDTLMTYGDSMQTTAPASPKKFWVNLRGGVVLPDFYRRSADAVRSPVFNKPLLGWQAGLSIEMAHSRWYGARIELSYVRKGANEVFAENNLRLESSTKLDYAQVVLLPLILKPGLRKIQPYLGVGGYVGYLLNASHSVAPNGLQAREDAAFGSYLNKLDYGWVASVGCYLWRHPLELRYEAGLTDLFKPEQVPASVRNQAVSLHFSL